MLWITDWCRELNNGKFSLDEQSFKLTKISESGECYLDWDSYSFDYDLDDNREYIRQNDYITTITQDGKKEYYQLTKTIEKRGLTLPPHLGKLFQDKMTAFRVNVPFDDYTMFDDCIIVNGKNNFNYSDLYYYEVRHEHETQSKERLVKITPDITESGYAKLVTYSHYCNNDKKETTLILQKV